MRSLFAIGVLLLSGGCSSFKPVQRPADRAPAVPVHQSAATREIEANRAEMAKTHVDGALVR